MVSLNRVLNFSPRTIYFATFIALLFSITFFFRNSLCRGMSIDLNFGNLTKSYYYFLKLFC